MAETGAVDTYFSYNKPFGEGTVQGSLASKREAFLASVPDLDAKTDPLIRIDGLAEYVIDRKVIDERRS